MIDELLRFGIESGIIDLATLQGIYDMKEKEFYLKQHDKKIYESGGSYLTRIGGKLVKRKHLSDLQDIIVEYYKGLNDHGIEKVFNEWLNNKLEYQEIQRQTFDRYQADFKRFIKGSIIDKEISCIDDELLEYYIKRTIRDSNLTAKGWAKIRTILIGTFKYAKRKKYTDFNIKEFLDSLELSPRIFRKRRFTDEESVFTDEEVNRLTRTVREREPSIINFGIVLAFQTGLRVGELSSLRWSDIKKDYIVVDKTEICYRGDDGHKVYEIRDNAKTDAGDRNVIILDNAKETLEQIRKLNPHGEYIFMQDGERVKGKAFTKKLERLCEQLDIVPKSMHKARKTYATKLIDAGVSESLIIRQMGHTDIKVTDNFYYFNNRTLNQSAEQLSKAFE